MKISVKINFKTIIILFIILLFIVFSTCRVVELLPIGIWNESSWNEAEWGSE